MLNPRKSAGWGLAIVSLALFAGTSVWIVYRSSGTRVAQDYEECAEGARADILSSEEYNRQVTRCGERFAGRRKAGGGYTYFDFMQNRSFDIAGPNPSADERKQIDQAYMQFLGAQRRETLSSDLAKRDADREQAALEAFRQDPGPPMRLVPKIPLPVKRPVIEHRESCEDGSLSCSWAKLSAAVKNAFASSGPGR